MTRQSGSQPGSLLTPKGDAMSALYTLASGETRTTCGAHRTAGYAIINGVWACRECKAPADQHESSDETLARKRAEAVESAARTSALCLAVVSA